MASGKYIDDCITDDPPQIGKKRKFKFVCPFCYAVYEFQTIELAKGTPHCNYCQKPLVKQVNNQSG